MNIAKFLRTPFLQNICERLLLDVVRSMYNLVEYSDNYSKTSGILWQYCRDEPAINVYNGTIVDFNAGNATTNSFKIKQKNNRSNRQQWQKKC